MKHEYLECGQVVGTHALSGEVRINPWCDSPEFLLKFKELYCGGKKTVLKIVKSRVHGNVVLAKFKGVDSIADAEKMHGSVLYIARKDVGLEKGRYFISDLIGCSAIGKKGEVYGVISDVSATGANDVWHIKSGSKEYLIPAIPDVVNSVDIDKGEVIITPLKGIFDDED